MDVSLDHGRAGDPGTVESQQQPETTNDLGHPSSPGSGDPGEEEFSQQHHRQPQDQVTRTEGESSSPGSGDPGEEASSQSQQQQGPPVEDSSSPGSGDPGEGTFSQQQILAPLVDETSSPGSGDPGEEKFSQHGQQQQEPGVEGALSSPGSGDPGEETFSQHQLLQQQQVSHNSREKQQQTQLGSEAEGAAEKEPAGKGEDQSQLQTLPGVVVDVEEIQEKDPICCGLDQVEGGQGEMEVLPGAGGGTPVESLPDLPPTTTTRFGSTDIRERRGQAPLRTRTRPRGRASRSGRSGRMSPGHAETGAGAATTRLSSRTRTTRTTRTGRPGRGRRPGGGHHQGPDPDGPQDQPGQRPLSGRGSRGPRDPGMRRMSATMRRTQSGSLDHWLRGGLRQPATPHGDVGGAQEQPDRSEGEDQGDS